MENVLDLVRNGELSITSTIVDVLFECFDALEEYVDNLEKTGNEGDLDSSELVQKLQVIAQKGEVTTSKATKKTASASAPKTEAKPEDENAFR
jgi:two-component system chemotaxis sensor kinase CheA